MKLSVKNINKPAPLWYRKLRKIVSLVSNTAVVILLGMGYSDNSFWILVCRIGISGLMDTIDIFLSDEAQN